MDYRPNYKGFEEIAVSAEIRAALREVAEKAKGIAEGLAQDFRITGDYADSFEVSEETIAAFGTTHHHRAAAARLTNYSDHAAAVEWGNEHAHRNHRVLGRTLDALGAP